MERSLRVRVPPRAPRCGILKRSTRADCKSAGLRLRWFESTSHNQSKNPVFTGFFCFIRLFVYPVLSYYIPPYPHFIYHLFTTYLPPRKHTATVRRALLCRPVRPVRRSRRTSDRQAVRLSACAVGLCAVHVRATRKPSAIRAQPRAVSTGSPSACHAVRFDLDRQAVHQ